MRDETSALVRSPLLKLPSGDVKLGYLGLNHWIFFAQASRFLTMAPRIPLTISHRRPGGSFAAASSPASS